MRSVAMTRTSSFASCTSNDSSTSTSRARLPHAPPELVVTPQRAAQLVREQAELDDVLQNTIRSARQRVLLRALQPKSPLIIARQPPPHHSTPFVDALPPSSAAVDQLPSSQPSLSTSQRPRIVPIPPSTRSLESTSSKVLRSPQLLEQIFAFSATNNYTQLEYNSRVVQVDQTYPSRQNTTRPRTPVARVARKPQAVYLATFPAFEDWDELDSSDDEDTLFPETVWTEFERNWYNSAIMRRTKRPSSKPVGRASVERILDKAVMRGLEPNGIQHMFETISILLRPFGLNLPQIALDIDRLAVGRDGAYPGLSAKRFCELHVQQDWEADGGARLAGVVRVLERVEGRTGMSTALLVKHVLASRDPRVPLQLASRAQVLATTESVRCLFCPMLFCEEHRQQSTSDVPLPPTQSTATAPCGKSCWRLVNKGMRQHVAERAALWPEEIGEYLRVLSETNASSHEACEVALEVDRPCDEVFRQLRLIRPRLLLANGLTLAEEAARRVASSKGSSARARPPAREVEPTASSDSWALRRLKPISAGQAYGSCYHEGSCMEAACACFNKKTYCDDSCACDSKCGRRFWGCTCASRRGEVVCQQSEECACFLAERECRPGLCGCDVSLVDNTKGQRRCANCKIQYDERKGTVIAESTLPDAGFGLFLVEEALPGDLLGTYAGDGFRLDLLDGRRREAFSDALAEHIPTRVSYWFDLDHGDVIDSLKKGNTLRFINHHPDRQNVAPRVTYLDSNYHIAISATKRIKAGSEVFLNYGANYHFAAQV